MKLLIDNFTRVNNDINGNPRYVCHFLSIPLTEDEKKTIDNLADANKDTFGVTTAYNFALAKVRKVGGKKYHNKKYGGGIVFQSYNLQSLCDDINNL